MNFQTPVKTKCPKCGGLGKQMVFMLAVSCKHCNGCGKSYELVNNDSTPEQYYNECDENEVK